VRTKEKDHKNTKMKEGNEKLATSTTTSAESKEGMQE
jgi:hypothetical protein